MKYTCRFKFSKEGKESEWSYLSTDKLEFDGETITSGTEFTIFTDINHLLDVAMAVVDWLAELGYDLVEMDMRSVENEF